MRKIMLFLAVCVALTACKKEVLTKGTPFQKGQTVTISAGAGGGSNAKVQGTDDGTNINFKWNEGDEIKVTVGGLSNTFRLKTGANSATATFEGEMPASGTHFDIQYPVDDPDLSTQDYVAGGVPKDKVKFTATNCTIDGQATLTVASAILKFQFKGTQQVSKMVVETVGYSTPEKSYTLNISGVTLSSTPTTFLMVAEPMTAKLKITLYNGSTVINSFTTSTAQNLTAGGCLTMPEKPVTEPKCLCFTALEAGCTVAMDDADQLNLEYSTDNGANFYIWNGAQITLNAGQKVYVQASSSGNTDMNNKKFTTEGNLKVSGNIMYLLKNDGSLTEITSDYCFQSLFQDASITDASELLLSATTLANACYYNMFRSCSELTKAPALPATNLVDECYNGMFAHCASLTEAPALPATTLAPGCYADMFSNCGGLITAPVLSAQTLTNYCYSNMFYSCSNLTAVTILATNVTANGCLSDWLQDAGVNSPDEKYCYVSSNASLGTLSAIDATLPDGWTATEAR